MRKEFRNPMHSSRSTEHGAPSDEFISGRRPVLEALQAGKRSLHKIWIQTGAGGSPVDEIVKLARERGVPVEWSPRLGSDPRFRKGSDPSRMHHQGIVAQVSAASFLELDDYLAKLGSRAPALLVALDEIEDPHNVGAILRSAGFFGVSALLVPRWRSAPVGDTAARVSSGAIEHVPLIRVRNLAEAILQLKDAGFEVIGADMAGEDMGSDPMKTWGQTPFNKGSDPSRPDPSRPRIVLVFGSEGKGLRRLVRERCDKLVSIPGSGQVASLNVGAAAAIFLYELCRRQEGSQPRNIV